jgi:hypothetical protein
MAASKHAESDTFIAVTDADLARARQDAQFRQRLVSDNLERLLAALNHLRNSTGREHAEGAHQLQEGVALALRLAALLQRISRDCEDSPAGP